MNTARRDSAGLFSDHVNAVAAEMSRQLVAFEQSHHPSVFGSGLLAEGTGFEQGNREAGVLEQLVNLSWRIFPVVTRIGFGFAGRGLDIGVKKSGMIALQHSGQAPQCGDIRRGKDEVSARLEDAVHFRHQVHRVLIQVLDQLTA
jgi:hypothetical protein